MGFGLTYHLAIHTIMVKKIIPKQIFAIFHFKNRTFDVLMKEKEAVFYSFHQRQNLKSGEESG